MNRTRTYAVAAAIASLMMASAASAGITHDENGIYREWVSARSSGKPDHSIVYLADTKTRLCFAKPGGDSWVHIPCDSLAQRKGWGEVLGWVLSSR